MEKVTKKKEAQWLLIDSHFLFFPFTQHWWGEKRERGNEKKKKKTQG